MGFIFSQKTITWAWVSFRSPSSCVGRVVLDVSEAVLVGGGLNTSPGLT